jgi:hypothetical protein
MLWHAKSMQKYLCSMMKSGLGSSEQLRSYLRMYNNLKILQLEHNQIWADCYIYSVLTALTIIMFNVLQFVLNHSAKSIFMAPAMWYLISGVLSSVASHYQVSTQVLQCWKSQAHGIYVQKYLRHMRPLYTDNGKFGFIDCKLQLTLLGIIINNSVSLIVGQKAGQ